MFAIKLDLLLVFMLFNVSGCERRIINGRLVSVDKGYVVYLTKAPIASQHYLYWLCGGAIVSSWFVVTSAACVKDVDYLYVIAGYRKYIHEDDITTDPCTKDSKKRVVYTCAPKGYQLKYEELDYWSYIDIALVKVDTAYNFNDDFYTQHCSYKPTIIPINYDTKYIEPGTDSMVFGWGHSENDGWRKPGDKSDHNSEELKYASTMILNKTVCIEHYDDYANMSKVIDRYMICTLGSGNLNDKGNTMIQVDPFVNGCTRTQLKILGFEGESCEDDYETNSDELNNYMYYDQARRSFNKTNNKFEMNFNETADADSNIKEYNGRRNGFCQNDHGGPLITWVGSREVLIGVASVFKVSEESDCMGPYLYTSTVKCSLFLECVLNTGDLPESGKPRVRFRRDLCDRPAEEKGFETIERYISWKDYPDFSLRSLKPIFHFQRTRVGILQWLYECIAFKVISPAYKERHKKKEIHRHRDAKDAEHKVFADQKFNENKRFPTYIRIRPNYESNALKDKNIANAKNHATERHTTDTGRYLFKAFPKLVRPETNRIAMRPLLPLRN